MEGHLQQGGLIQSGYTDHQRHARDAEMFRRPSFSRIPLPTKSSHHRQVSMHVGMVEPCSDALESVDHGRAATAHEESPRIQTAVKKVQNEDITLESPLCSHIVRNAAHRFVCIHIGCKKSFGRAQDLGRHIRSDHVKEDAFYCPAGSCEYNGTTSKAFHRKDNANRHVKNKHPDLPPLQ